MVGRGPLLAYQPGDFKQREQSPGAFPPAARWSPGRGTGKEESVNEGPEPEDRSWRKDGVGGGGGGGAPTSGWAGRTGASAVGQEGTGTEQGRAFRAAPLGVPEGWGAGRTEMGCWVKSWG